MGLFNIFKKNKTVQPTEVPKPLPADSFDASCYAGFHQPEFKL